MERAGVDETHFADAIVARFVGVAMKDVIDAQRSRVCVKGVLMTMEHRESFVIQFDDRRHGRRKREARGLQKCIQSDVGVVGVAPHERNRPPRKFFEHLHTTHGATMDDVFDTGSVKALHRLTRCNVPTVRVRHYSYKHFDGPYDVTFPNRRAMSR